MNHKKTDNFILDRPHGMAVRTLGRHQAKFPTTILSLGRSFPILPGAFPSLSRCMEKLVRLGRSHQIQNAPEVGFVQALVGAGGEAIGHAADGVADEPGFGGFGGGGLQRGGVRFAE